ncbi:hypothetical protein CCH79_00020201 [Gambusia affinis]|uniref:ABC transporter domain-containing protein n=1 Tax=Gambusia affinis TaxID=33528 RepID=A0A315W8R1_GAMAF|nr:hypothetical protein CCH79_00020201 [Gambusia affinis]
MSAFFPSSPGWVGEGSHFQCFRLAVSNDYTTIKTESERNPSRDFPAWLWCSGMVQDWFGEKLHNMNAHSEELEERSRDAQNSDLRRTETRSEAAETSTMALSTVLETPGAGFNFENTTRNAALEGLFEGGQTPKPLKTGTTIAGVVFKDGVVLGADTRATSSEVVADKMCEKIHFISPNICCGAGTAADTEKTTDLLSSNLSIFSLNSGRNPRVVMAVNILQDMLYRYHGQIGANLILGGVDCTGNHLYTVGPYGDVDKIPYLAMGSGDLAALGILEDGFISSLFQLEEAKELVRSSIHAGIMSDLGSGNNTDICVITKEGVDYIRPYQESEDNITYGLTDCSQEKIEEAARKANAHEFIQQQEKGYDTEVGESGGQLSKSEKQRIGIARALVREPKVIILDEITSSLDAESENKVLQGLASCPNQTLLVIAHRLKTIENADQIVVVKGGKVEEKGTHKELMEQQGSYHKLINEIRFCRLQVKKAKEQEGNLPNAA